MGEPDNKPTTLEECLIGAFISAIAMACTIAALSFLFFIIAAKGRYAGIQLFFNFVFSEFSLYIIGLAALLGSFLSFDKMVSIFSTLWGTNPEYDIHSTNKFVIASVLAAVIVAAVLLLRQ